MKTFLGEIFDPIIEFYKMRVKVEIFSSIFFPMVCGIMSFFIGTYMHPIYEFSIVDFCSDMLNQILTILTLFISFSMAYLSIIITSSSKNIDGLKGTESEKYFLNGKPCTLYQVLASEITYTVVFEIFYLVFVLLQKFVIYISNNLCIQIILAIDITMFVHVLLMMLIVIKNIYYSFWKSR